MTNWNVLSKYLFEFENTYGQELAALKYRNFNAWQIVKIPLYFNNINTVPSASSLARRKFLGYRILKKTAGAASLLTQLISLWVGSNFKSSNRVLFFTFAGDKLAKDEDGKYFNFLVDGFISSGLIGNYIYAETSVNGDYKQPSRVNIDFKVDQLYTLFPLFKRMSKEELRESEFCVNKLNEKLQSFSDKHGSLKVDMGKLRTIFSMFSAELKLFRFFLGICRPKLIITSEKPGTSFLAAAKSMNIPVLDVQHGIIDKHHPQYIYAEVMSNSKKDMILPDWIALFGNFHREILLKTGFWSDNELTILGSSRMEMNRNRYRTEGKERNIILIPTQWTYYSETCRFLERFIPMISSDYKVVLKLHPLERENHINGYVRLIDDLGYDNIQIVGQSEDIYPLISLSKFVIGFDSAVLLEAISLGTPCITLCTTECPEGIHSLFNESTLKTSIKPVNLHATEELALLIKNSLGDPTFYKEWENEVMTDAENLFARDYVFNCKQFLSRNVSVN